MLILKNEFINIYMKAALLCILVLAATAVEFETFQEALDFDP